MSANEKRRNARSSLNIGDENNRFYLIDGAHSLEISEVRDVSISGVGLSVHRLAFEAGQSVSLKYDSDDFELTIDGTVAWCNQVHDDGTCHMGIEFDPHNRENNSLFFLALRKYLDEFDSAYIDA